MKDAPKEIVPPPAKKVNALPSQVQFDGQRAPAIVESQRAPQPATPIIRNAPPIVPELGTLNGRQF